MSGEALTFLGYRELAMRTAVYPKSARVQYPALMLAGEAGEAAEKLVEFEPGGDPGGLLAELGDVLWNAAALTRDLEAREAWMSLPLAELEAAVDDVPLSLAMLRLVAAATAPAERYGKLLRDGGFGSGGGLPAPAAGIMLASARDTVLHLAACARAVGASLEGVARANVAKLASRFERGVIHGSGDDR